MLRRTLLLYVGILFLTLSQLTLATLTSDSPNAWGNPSKPPNSTFQKRKKGLNIVAPTKTPTKKASTQRPTGKAPKSTAASSSLRRLKTELRDIIQTGIAYNWVLGRPISSSNSTRITGSNTTESSKQDGTFQQICLGPVGSNLRDWHFSFRGSPGSPFQNGIYHGRMMLPKDYPATPPRVQLWTPSGRFQPYKDICLSASSFHPESWTPQWTILALVQALRLHMITNPQEIGGILRTREEIQEYAEQSITWKASWEVGKVPVIVDHARMLQQGVLAIPGVFVSPLEEEEYDGEPVFPVEEHISTSTKTAPQVDDPLEYTSSTSAVQPQSGDEDIQPTTRRIQRRRHSNRRSLWQSAGLSQFLPSPTVLFFAALIFVWIRLYENP
eukprot:Nitzschia sp. Nitz4//scaffold13_size275219//200406//201560//NITZ4_000900-RA/size275219-processed-gene-0.103-mRNA-1//1//CDS//3329536092//8371//frame0